jgi:hypothetical protein
VDARDLVLPRGATAGASVTWRHEGAGGPDEDLALETLACVERTPDRATIEWRRELRGGRTEVIAARFKPDGTLLGAWRGPPGGAGKPLRVVRGEFGEEAAREEVARKAAPFGGVPDAKTTTTHENVETPAGRFRCTVHRVETTFLFATARMAWAHAEEPIPLSRMVRMEWRGAGMDYVQELVAVQQAGAIPSLTIPE